MSDTSTSIYGSQRLHMEEVMDRIVEEINDVRRELTAKTGSDPVEHLLARIKSEESMREKCRRKGLPEDEHSALVLIHDGIGIRVVCSFIDDVYVIRERLGAMQGAEIVEEKDYIRRSKPNGYRSLHMILRFDGSYYAEIQLRTISMDVWAALEHHMKYKKKIGGNTALITAELKRCADELASTDLSMQTIRDMILEEGE
ncbi:MAG: GTP pyrophosphokinase family protein [Lachnospiraceae bacterium]|nr:GTP pyrophosphokinase family protein [Lachnospiraceae bacterium]